jgi:hypothetical protein
MENTLPPEPAVPIEGAKPIFTLTAPCMTDTDGAFSLGVSLTLTEGEGAQTVTVSADEAWLAAPERAYPVFIDPTYELRENEIFYGVVQAFGLNSSLDNGPNTEHVGLGYLYAGLENGSLVGVGGIIYGQSWSYLRINNIDSFIATYFSDLPEEAIISAKVHAYRYAGVGGYRTVSARMLQQPLTAPYTWNNRPLSMVDLANSADVSQNGWVAWDITDAFRAWKNDPTQNYGLMLRPDSEVQAAVTFAGPNNEHNANRLYFELNWTVPNPVDENKPLDAPNVNLRPLTYKNVEGLQVVTGLFADGEVRPQLDVDYVLFAGDLPVGAGTYAKAQWGKKFPDSTPFDTVIPFTLGYTELYESNWQSDLFVGLEFNLLYIMKAVAYNETENTPPGQSDTFIIYQATATDTLPYVPPITGLTACN